MDFRVKLVLSPIPIIIAGYVGIAMLQPSLEEANGKEATLQEKRQEKETKERQLSAAGNISKKRIELTDAIDKLRGSVPKAPDIDLLTIDLERMCKDAGMNMVAIQTPKDSPTPVSANYTKGQDKLRGALKSGVTAAGAAAAGGGANAGGAAKKEEEEEPVGPELQTTSKQFVVTGDFNGLEKLVHLLETYQRVVKIDDITFRVPRKPSSKDKVQIEDAAPGDGDEAGDPRLLFVTMTLTTYYLP